MTTTWPEVALGELCRFQNGGTPSRSIPEYFDGTIPWLTGADIAGPVAYDCRSYVSEAGVAASPACVVPALTILLVTRTGVGKVAVAGRELSFSQDITGLIPDATRIATPYLVHFLRTQAARFKAESRGATIQGITRGVVSCTRVPLPPIEEQRRIAAILDSADELRAKRQESVALIDSLTESTFLNMFGDRRTNPHRLPVVPLVDLVDPASPIARGIDQPGPHFPGGIPYIKTTDFGGPIRRDQLACADPEIAARSPRAKVLPGDCVICIRATVGPAMLITSDLAGVNLSRGTARVAPRQGVLPRFLLATLQSRDFQNQITERLRGATFLQIPLGELRKLEVLCPPTDLQEEFALRAEAAEAVATHADADERELDVLFASLQHRAFRGEL